MGERELSLASLAIGSALGSYAFVNPIGLERRCRAEVQGSHTRVS